MKEQINDKLKEFITYAREEGVTDDEIYMLMEDVFPQAHWVFKTNKLTPLQVKACVCQQCPFPGELETKCDWCDNPKMLEFLWLALPAIDDFYQHHEAQALKEQMERVMGVIDEHREFHKGALREGGEYYVLHKAVISALNNLKTELESE